MINFSNKAIVITGAGSGIGCAATEYLAKAGAKIIASDLNYESCRRMAETINKRRPGSVESNYLDVSNKEDVDMFFEKKHKEYGVIDGLVHCAGYSSVYPFNEIPEAEIDKVLSVNVKGTLFVLQAVGKIMCQQKHGKICIVGSKNGKVGIPVLAHYAASKFAIVGLVQSAAMAFAKYGVYVNSVCPGEVDTPFLRKAYQGVEKITNISLEEQYKNGNRRALIGRISKPDHLVGTIAFLISEESSEIIGQSINADGGIVFQ